MARKAMSDKERLALAAKHIEKARALVMQVGEHCYHTGDMPAAQAYADKATALREYRDALID